MIGHMKNEGRLDICPLLGIEGSKFHAILCGCAHNLRLLINYVKNHTEKFVAIPPTEDQVHA